VFVARFAQMFNAQNFFYCVYYIKDYVDFERSSARGRWYMQNIFANLGLFTFRWIKGGKKNGARQYLIDAYDTLALNSRYDEIMIDDFQQLTQKYRNDRESKKRNFSQIDAEIADLGEMPKKASARTPADRRAKPIDVFDDDDEEMLLR
jgi:hypothetical protein